MKNSNDHDDNNYGDNADIYDCDKDNRNNYDDDDDDNWCPGALLPMQPITGHVRWLRVSCPHDNLDGLWYCYDDYGILFVLSQKC